MIITRPVAANEERSLRSGFRLPSCLGADSILLLPELRGERLPEVIVLEDLANLDLGVLEGSALEPLDPLCLVSHLPQPEPGDELLGLGERSVNHGLPPLGEFDTGSLRAGLEPFTREHHPGFDQLFVELAHLGQHLLVGESPSFRSLVAFDQHHETHCSIPLLVSVFGRLLIRQAPFLSLRTRRTNGGEIDTLAFFVERGRQRSLVKRSRKQKAPASAVERSTYWRLVNPRGNCRGFTPPRPSPSPSWQASAPLKDPAMRSLHWPPVPQAVSGHPPAANPMHSQRWRATAVFRQSGLRANRSSARAGRHKPGPARSSAARRASAGPACCSSRSATSSAR